MAELTLAQALDHALNHHTHGRLSQAGQLYQQILAVAPQNVSAMALLGHVQYCHGQLQDAHQLLSKALSLKPDYIEALNNLGLVQEALGMQSEAIASYEKAVALNPRFAMPYINLGGIYLAQGQLEKARHCSEQALAINPDSPEALSNLAKIYKDSGDNVKAESMYHALVKDNPQFADGLNNLGDIYLHKGHLKEAMGYFKKAINADKNMASAHFNKALVHLIEGDFDVGFKEYLWRFRNNSGKVYLPRPEQPDSILPLPQTMPENFWQGKHVALLAEQGIGDEWFFLRFARQIKALGADITCQASAKIFPLVREIKYLDRVVQSKKEIMSYDVACGVGDLPLLLGLKHKEHIPPSIDFKKDLSSDFNNALAGTAQKWQDLLSACPRPWLGLTWRGGIKNTTGSLFKNIPLNELINAVKSFSGTLVVVQRNPREDELCELGRVFSHLVDASCCNDNLLDASALLGVLDDYLGVSNTNMHLRASTGRHAKVLVPMMSEFRWMKGSSSAWFPDYQLYRESCENGWQHALDAIRRDLNN